MHIYVRRGGPNYQTGLTKMRALGEELGVPLEVFFLTNSNIWSNLIIAFVFANAANGVQIYKFSSSKNWNFVHLQIAVGYIHSQF